VECIPRASSTRPNSPHCRCRRGFRPAAGWRRSLDESVRNCNCVTHTHGGLTPAALVNVRFCIAKIVIISADGRRSRNKSGGRKPPVERDPDASSRPRNSPHCRCRRGLQSTVGRHLPLLIRQSSFAVYCSLYAASAALHRTHGGLTPAAGRKRPQLQLRYSHPQRAHARRSCSCVAWSPNIAWFPRHSARFTEPRRADPCRSCERAFVRRKNRFSPANVRSATRAGGVSPRGAHSAREFGTPKLVALPLQPWFPTSGRLASVAGRKCSQLQLRYSHPRRAHARRSWLCIRRSPNITRLSPDGVLIPVP
jgi:hypothetical protein